MATFRSFTGFSLTDLGLGGNPGVGETFDISGVAALNVIVEDNDDVIEGDVTNESSGDAEGDQFLYILDGAGNPVVDGEPLYLESIVTFTIGGQSFQAFHFESDDTGQDFFIFPPGVPAGAATITSVAFNPNPNEVNVSALASGDELVDHQDFLNLTLTGDDEIITGDGDDTILADDGADTVNAGDGDDIISGQAGTDSLSGGAGADTIFGGGGADSALGDDDDDLIDGGANDDTLFGGAGADTLFGGVAPANAPGANVVSTSWTAIQLTHTDDIDPDESNGQSENAAALLGTFGDAADPLHQKFHSVATNDASNDGFQNDDDFNSAPEAFTIDGKTVFMDSAQVYDATVTFADGSTGGFSAVVFQLTDGTVYLAPEFSDNADNTLLTSAPIESITLDSILFNNVSLFASRVDAAYLAVDDGGDDSLFGGDGDDVIDGGDGDDLALGDAGGDSIDGGQGSDTLAGGADDDTIDGGDGSDSLVGGEGFDTFLVSSGDDTISDFNTGAGQDFNDGNQANNDFLDLAPFYDDFFEARADLADDGLLNQSNALDTKGAAVDYSDNTALPGTIALTGTPPGDLTFDNVNLVCFVRGARIATPDGERRIETLKPGDLVATLDHGPQPLRWIGSRRVAAVGAFAPVRIRAGALGAARELWVSQQHRMLVRSGQADLLFGAPEVLVAAKHLVDGDDIAIVEGGEVEFTHILFDNHEIVFAEGAPTESFQPCAANIGGLGDDARDEILALFPELSSLRDRTPARPSLRAFEVAALAA